MNGHLRFPCLVAVALASLPIPALSQDSTVTGWYAGGGFAVNDIYSYANTCYGCYGSSVYGDSGFGPVLTAGYRMGQFLAFEASYLGESRMHWDQNAVAASDAPGLYDFDVDVDLTSAQVAALGILAGEYWEAYLKLGIALWDANAEQRLVTLGTGEVRTRTLAADGTGLLVGVGVGRRYSNGWQLRLDYAFFHIDDELLLLTDPNQAYFDTLLVQAVRRFGARPD